MKKLQYTVRFVTPAFLGNAEQNGQWRTPPFKAQLRQWWRVVYAAEHGFPVNVNDMRREEGLLFGNAWLENDFRKSLVRLRLDRWDEGNLKKSQWPKDATVIHPEVKDRHTNQPRPVGSALYLGYGPLGFDKGTALKAKAAIQAGETATLSIAFPTTHQEPAIRRLAETNAPRIERALWLMDRYGTLGGRSRNGWGSFSLTPTDDASALTGTFPERAWRECLGSDWPHAIGSDDRGNPLIWQTQPFTDWKALMKRLAEIKIGLRTHFSFTTGRNAPAPEDRHWLSYPVTNHSVNRWDNNARMPNTLRFKVRQAAGGKLVGAILHVPHLPPAAFHPNRHTIIDVWLKVHAFLDAPAQQLTRIPE